MLRHVHKLHNQYYALRHGQSLANVEGVISSNPAVSTKMHGLSGIGKAQADTAAAKFVEEMCAKRSRVAIFSSDFKRARETASAFEVPLLTAANNGHGVGELFSGKVVLDQRLRERFFGEFDGGPDSNYEKVWVEDAKVLVCVHVTFICLAMRESGCVICVLHFAGR
jgi:broad specificity phosphatase PhoE